jgi:hypothetical protein
LQENGLVGYEDQKWAFFLNGRKIIFTHGGAVGGGVSRGDEVAEGSQERDVSIKGGLT